MITLWDRVGRAGSKSELVSVYYAQTRMLLHYAVVADRARLKIPDDALTGGRKGPEL